MGIDIWEVIERGKNQAIWVHGVLPRPGAWRRLYSYRPILSNLKAREFGQNTRFIELAGEVNTSMPEYVIHRVSAALNARRKSVNGSKVLVLGLAYKPNVDGDRESRSYAMDLLKKLGAEVLYYDPYVPVIRRTREHPHWAGTKSIEWNQESVQDCDLVLIATITKWSTITNSQIGHGALRIPEML